MSSEDESDGGDAGGMAIEDAYAMYAEDHNGQYPITQKQFLSFINVGRGAGRWQLKFADVRAFWDRRDPVATAKPKHLDVVNRGQYGDENSNYDENSGDAGGGGQSAVAARDDEDDEDDVEDQDEDDDEDEQPAQPAQPAVEDEDEDDDEEPDEDDEDDEPEPEPEPSPEPEAPAEPEPEPEVDDDEDDDEDDEDAEDDDSDE